MKNRTWKITAANKDTFEEKVFIVKAPSEHHAMCEISNDYFVTNLEIVKK